jgi:hypothetical protein
MQKVSGEFEQNPETTAPEQHSANQTTPEKSRNHRAMPASAMAGPSFKLHADMIGVSRFTCTPLSRDDVLKKLKQKERQCPLSRQKTLPVAQGWNKSPMVHPTGVVWSIRFRRFFFYVTPPQTI